MWETVRGCVSLRNRNLKARLWIARRKTLKTFVRISSKNSASGTFIHIKCTMQNVYISDVLRDLCVLWVPADEAQPAGSRKCTRDGFESAGAAAGDDGGGGACRAAQAPVEPTRAQQNTRGNREEVLWPREYWIIYRGPGFPRVAWFGSSATPSPPLLSGRLRKRKAGKLGPL